MVDLAESRAVLACVAGTVLVVLGASDCVVVALLCSSEVVVAVPWLVLLPALVDVFCEAGVV